MNIQQSQAASSLYKFSVYLKLRQNLRNLNKESRLIKNLLLRYDKMQPKFYNNEFLQGEINKKIFELEEQEARNFIKRQESQTSLDIHVETRIYGPNEITIN